MQYIMNIMNYMCIEYFPRIKILGASLLLTPELQGLYKSKNLSLSLSLALSHRLCENYHKMHSKSCEQRSSKIQDCWLSHCHFFGNPSNPNIHGRYHPPWSIGGRFSELGSLQFYPEVLHEVVLDKSTKPPFWGAICTWGHWWWGTRSCGLVKDIQTTGWKVLEDCFEMAVRNNSCVFLKKISVSRCCFLDENFPHRQQTLGESDPGSKNHQMSTSPEDVDRGFKRTSLKDCSFYNVIFYTRVIRLCGDGKTCSAHNILLYSIHTYIHTYYGW